MQTPHVPTPEDIAAARVVVANPHTVPAHERAEVFATAWFCLTFPRRLRPAAHLDGDAA
jgi:hypothetical protein